MKFFKKPLAVLLTLTMVIGIFAVVGVNTSAAELIDQMTLREKITQMMMVDFRKWDEDPTDSTPSSNLTTVNPQVSQVVEDYKFGAVILFSNNIADTEQTLNLTKDLQAAATKNGGIPLMIATDQEGGVVYRLATGTALPGNMALGATYAANGTKYAKEAGEIIGSELNALGINANFASVVDVNNNANNPVIGLRSYSDDADMVGELAAATIEGMNEYNVVGAAAHFPGHGDTATDYHYGLPLVDKSLSDFNNNELKPYNILIGKGLDMVMACHILCPQLESDKIVSVKTGVAESLPATMSDDILTELLKNDMGFGGIVVTDAMNMAGISAIWDPIQACVVAIQAGVDMICMPTTLYDLDDLTALDAIIDGIEDAVDNGDIPMTRINDAVSRILKVKKDRGILDYNAADYTLEKANGVVGCEANREMEREISAAAVTVVKNENNTLPLKLTNTSKVLMLVPYDNERGQTIMAWNRAKQAGIIPEGAEVKYCRFSSSDDINAIKTELDWANTIIVNSEVSSTSRMNGKHWLSAMPINVCDYAAANNKTAIVMSVDKPYDVQSYSNADAVVAVYGCKGSSVDPEEALTNGITGSEAAYGPNIIAGVEVILGTFAAQGKLPLDIPVYDKDSNVYTDTNVYERGYGLTYDAVHVCAGTLKDGTEADCENDGYKAYYECECGKCYLDENCEEEIADINEWKSGDGLIPALNHPETTDTVVTEATCSKEGVIETTCDICGDVIATTAIEKLPHAETIDVPTTKPTCTDAGIIETFCTECGEKTATKPVESTGHDEGIWKVDFEATAEHDGQMTRYCTKCDAVLETKTFEKHTHTEGYTKTIPATCTQDGEKATFCADCGTCYKTEVIEKTGHGETVETVSVKPSCTQAGENVKYCKDCGVAVETVVVEATDHAWSAYSTNANGSHSKTCYNCGVEEKENCTYTATSTASTCLETGYTKHECDVCGHSYIDTATEALGHKWGEWTDDENGTTHTRECTACDETETHDHEWGEWTYNEDGTFTENGTKTRACAICGAEETDTANHTSDICRFFYPIICFFGNIVHKILYGITLDWLFPEITIKPEF